MEKILFFDFELNQPLTLLTKFNKWLVKEGGKLDMFWAKDYAKAEKPSLDEKMNSANIYLIRKPLTFLTSPTVREKIQNAIMKEKKNLLLMMSILDLETLGVVKDFLVPFNIEPTETRAIDNEINLKGKRSVIFYKKNKCFSDHEIFKSVNKIVIPDANLLNIEPPAKILIRGNPSTETFDHYNDQVPAPPALKGSDIIVGAYYDATGRILVINSTIFLDKFFEFNKPFIKNVISWISTGTDKIK